MSVSTEPSASPPLASSAARWRLKGAFWGTDAEASASLLGLSHSANYASMGVETGAGSRLSLSVTDAQDDTLAGFGASSAARGAAMGYTFQPTAAKWWQVSV